MSANLITKDQEARLHALNPARSFIVQAPAGSGKTELLIQRFLTLLSYAKNPEEILAITFTKKAANEMRFRVIKALRQAQNETEPLATHQKKTWDLAKKVLARDERLQWHILDNPNQLHIQTIDSLCAFLTKQLPFLSHFGAEPQIADHPQQLYQEAVLEILTQCEEDPDELSPLSTLLYHLDNDLNKLQILLGSLLAKRDQWLPYIQFNIEDDRLRNALAHHLQLVIAERLNYLIDIFPANLFAELQEIACFTVNKSDWLTIATLLLTKNLTWRQRFDTSMGFPPLNTIKNKNEKLLHLEYRQRLKNVIENLSTQQNIHTALVELLHLPDPHYTDTQWETLSALLKTLKMLIVQLRVTFQTHGKIDFIENMQAALIALGTEDAPTDLALALDYQIKHILVDEFQDTSSTQYHLLQKLTAGWEQQDGRTLFIVGDPMQSIYRFREAEVGLFLRMRQHPFGTIQLTPLTLTVNFRSHHTIVDWNNTHFEKIFPPANDILTGAVHYSPSTTLGKNMAANAEVLVYGFISEDNKAQANHIITLIQNTHAANPTDNIAILVRSRAHLKLLPELLQQKNISYQAIDIDPLSARPYIQDLFCLTSALLHPADRVAWFSLLRSPWCGLTLEDLLIIAGNHRSITIIEQCNRHDIIAQLSHNGGKRLNLILPILKNQLAHRARTDLRYLIESTWILLGGPATLPHPAAMEDVNQYFTLLTKMSTTALFNRHQLEEALRELYAATEVDHARVQIMTIHSAKGLEFDTVIVPHLEKKTSSDDKPLLSWMEQPLMQGENALLLAAATGITNDKLYDYIQRQHQIKADFEMDRLLYVAATRAKKRLYLTFTTQKNASGDLASRGASFLDKLLPVLNKNNLIIHEINTPPRDTNETALLKKLQRLTIDWQNPITVTPLQPIVLHQQSGGFQFHHQTAQQIGIVIHRVLQLLSVKGINWWENQSAIQQDHYLCYQLKQLNCVTSAFESALRTAKNALSQTLSDPRGRWILAPHREAQSEYALTALIEGQITNLVIDRTFIDNETGIRWIIDYKTSTLSQPDLHAFLQKEQKKYSEKMKIYQQALKLIDPHSSSRLSLYFPVLQVWHEIS